MVSGRKLWSCHLLSFRVLWRGGGVNTTKINSWEKFCTSIVLYSIKMWLGPGSIAPTGVTQSMTHPGAMVNTGIQVFNSCSKVIGTLLVESRTQLGKALVHSKTKWTTHVSNQGMCRSHLTEVLGGLTLMGTGDGPDLPSLPLKS